MATDGLIAYWIVPPNKNGPLGFGVTARSLNDALEIIRGMRYEKFLPCDRAALCIVEGVTVAQLDQWNVVPRMGPIAVRGMWYPFVTTGVPGRADIQ
jgi:hypothetical protein